MLTERELQILKCLAQGKSSQDIADELNLSSETIKWYRKRMLSKFQASNSLEMVMKAMQQQILK
jgi:DNA-binding NarL/FixJ family response regulator